jgi:hypothetical protein
VREPVEVASDDRVVSIDDSLLGLQKRNSLVGSNAWLENQTMASTGLGLLTESRVQVLWLTLVNVNPILTVADRNSRGSINSKSVVLSEESTYIASDNVVLVGLIVEVTSSICSTEIKFEIQIVSTINIIVAEIEFCSGNTLNFDIVEHISVWNINSVIEIFVSDEACSGSDWSLSGLADLDSSGDGLSGRKLSFVENDVRVLQEVIVGLGGGNNNSEVSENVVHLSVSGGGNILVESVVSSQDGVGVFGRIINNMFTGNFDGVVVVSELNQSDSIVSSIFVEFSQNTVVKFV